MILQETLFQLGIEPFVPHCLLLMIVNARAYARFFTTGSPFFPLVWFVEGRVHRCSSLTQVVKKGCHAALFFPGENTGVFFTM